MLYNIDWSVQDTIITPVGDSYVIYYYIYGFIQYNKTI